MKTNVVILLCSLLMLSVSTTATAKEKNRQTTVFNVSIHCESCKEKIEKNIAFERGVKDLVVDVDAKTVTITYDTRKTRDEKLVEAFKKIGYEAAPKSTGSACGKKVDCMSKESDCHSHKGEKKADCDKPCGKEKKCDKPCDKDKEHKHCCDKKEE